MNRSTDHEGGWGHPVRRARRANLLVPLGIMGAAVGAVGWGFSVVDPAPAVVPACVVEDASVVVPDEGVLLGVNLDWASETLAEHRTNMGHAPAVAVQFSDIPYDDKTWAHTTSAVTQVKANGGVLLLTLEPHAGLDAMSDEVVDRLAKDLRALNEQGVPVVLRFAHEMNGSWYAWGQQPAHYVEVFRRVAAAVHAQAPGTSMMWAPNYGGGYPFTGGQFAARKGTDDYAALDTDDDGELTMADDTYLPYYPGDDAVDWVGISLYHWGNQRPWGNNEITEDGKFAAMLTGTYDGTAGDDDAIPDFYEVYGVEHDKPVAIPETSAIYTPSRAGESELDVKRAWWRQVFSDDTHERFPQLKMINWFEWDKYEIEINDTVDWRAAGSPAVRDAFVADLPSWTLDAPDVPVCGEAVRAP
ncbi:glycosyl hydrolase family 26 [Sediminihabitans luteus]|uniref:Glycosyl hydrolase family 26 n=1 Tax=Sediminihabitans luteus TaxID=1138585 RepID=A0A2M9CYX3_9CELL|nr:glycosyl hydrolase [Sediminihabitans luteus]PJJ77129.1 glycosyl hydrolase family 26 [Sediminihabitans luteus]GII98577.1 hypothetical protein Slu03_09550 [Sediminihabitans luteus]